MTRTGTRAYTRRINKAQANEDIQDIVEEEPVAEEPNDGGEDGGEDEPEDDEDEDSGPDDDQVGPGALTPGRAMHGILRYTNRSHYYLYRNATQPLEEELFDCIAEQFF